jgi:hypothetical protein
MTDELDYVIEDVLDEDLPADDLEVADDGDDADG